MNDRILTDAGWTALRCWEHEKNCTDVVLTMLLAGSAADRSEWPLLRCGLGSTVASGGARGAALPAGIPEGQAFPHALALPADRRRTVTATRPSSL